MYGIADIQNQELTKRERNMCEHNLIDARFLKNTNFFWNLSAYNMTRQGEIN